MTSSPVVLITGASSGIGWATAKRLSEEGFDLALAARRKERLQTLAKEIKTKTNNSPLTIP